MVDATWVMFLLSICCENGLRDGVIAASSPRIASENAPYSQCQSLERTMFKQCLSGVFRTRRRKSARWRCEGWDAILIEKDGQKQYLYQNLHDEVDYDSDYFHSFSLIRCNKFFTFSATSFVGYSAASSHTKAIRTLLFSGTCAVSRWRLQR